MPTAPARTLTVTLRWDGPRLSRDQLAARANEALARIEKQFRHVARDPQTLPSEEQQYVQVIIHLEATDAEAEQYKLALKDAFSQAAMSATRGSAAAQRREIAAPVAFTYKSDSRHVTATNATHAVQGVQEELQAGSWIGLFLFVVLLLVATAVAFYGIAQPFFPEALDFIRSFM